MGIFKFVDKPYKNDVVVLGFDPKSKNSVTEDFVSVLRCGLLQ